MPPPAELAPWIECIWTLQGGPGATEPILPDGRNEIILHFGDRFMRHTSAGAELQPRALFVGPMMRAARIQPTGRVDVLGIRLRPGAAGSLLRHRLDRLHDEIPALDDVSPALGAITEAVDPVEPPARRLERLNGFLRQAFRGARAPDSRLTAAVHALQTTRSVDAAVHASGWSHRQLQRRFREEVGFGPKTLGRILRLQAAVRAAPSALEIGWSRIAVRSGYFDQAHLIREFREVTGRTPAEFFGVAHPLSSAFIAGGEQPRTGSPHHPL